MKMFAPPYLYEWKQCIIGVFLWNLRYNHYIYITENEIILLAVSFYLLFNCCFDTSSYKNEIICEFTVLYTYIYIFLHT